MELLGGLAFGCFMFAMLIFIIIGNVEQGFRHPTIFDKDFGKKITKEIGGEWKLGIYFAIALIIVAVLCVIAMIVMVENRKW